MLTGAQAGELAEILTAAAGRVSDQPYRSVAVTADSSIVRTRTGWLAGCTHCEAAQTPLHLPTRGSYREAEQDAEQHRVTVHHVPD